MWHWLFQHDFTNLLIEKKSVNLGFIWELTFLVAFCLKLRGLMFYDKKSVVFILLVDSTLVNGEEEEDYKRDEDQNF